ncbi:MAG: cyclopropane-fatty-acyl-phospholipid synthase [Gammaproteobacteria bacterium]|nr:MAG: cyclopropane-fatty-acyl-phospholipid synthase [Gammaproteobacteria bacterium]
MRQENIKKALTEAKIYGPDSERYLKQEKSLTRYLEREYKTYLNNPITLESTGVSTVEGPIMDQTEDLMDVHYDETIELFMGFLDTRYRAYTMAYYGTNGDDKISLETAQYQKFRLIAERAQIQGNEKILNIGCGFGSLETYLLQEYPGIEIVGITPSKVQITYLKEKMQDSTHPLSNRFTLIEDVFDEAIVDKLGLAQYDLIISIGVFEQLLNMKLMLELISKLLRTNGRSFHHFITSQVVTPQVKLNEKTVIGKYFPGGRIWPRDEFSRHTEHLDLVNTWFVNGKNYWQTLDEWHHRYWKSIPSLYCDDFNLDAIRHWNEYFLLCKAMFSPLDGTFYGNSHYLFCLKP